MWFLFSVEPNDGTGEGHQHVSGGDGLEKTKGRSSFLSCVDSSLLQRKDPSDIGHTYF